MSTVISAKRPGLVTWAPWIFVFLWSTGFVAAKFTIQYAEPFRLAFMRGAISCVAFALLAVCAGAGLPSRREVSAQLRVGLLLHAAFLGGCFYAIHRGMPAGLVALITGMQPILTAIYVSAHGNQRLGVSRWIGILIGFLGVFLVLSPGGKGFSVDPWALLSAVVGLLGVTAGAIYQKRSQGEGHILATTCVQYVALTLSMGVLTLVFEHEPVQWSVSFGLGLAWMVLGVSVLAILLLIFMIRHGESTRVATYFYLVPVLTTIEAWAIFNESISWSMAAGMALTIIGMFFVMRRA